LFDWIHSQSQRYPLTAIGHRIVHGGPQYAETGLISAEMIVELKRITSFDPLHLPVQIRLIEEVGMALKDIPQFASFDTAFHKDLPTVSRLLPLPRSYEKAGIRRYGFHGLSYRFLLSEIETSFGLEAAQGRLILAHLGNGASLAAVKDGKSIDTSMGFTPAGGVPMSTRSGDLDPGILTYLAQQPGWDGKHLDRLVNAHSGLLGISETSADMEQLLKAEDDDSRAADAVDIFCYHIKKTIGAYSAALGGIDRIIFTGGMGQEAPKIRTRITSGLSYLGIEIDPMRNNANDRTISSYSSRVSVHVLPTDEALTIARDLVQLLPDLTNHKTETTR
jgi:acetate kinase